MRIHADRAGCSRAQAVLPLRSQSTEEEANSVDRALTDSKHSIYLVFWHLQKQKLIADWLKNISSYPPLWCYIHIHICFYFFSMPLTLLLLCACQIHPGVYRTERMRERDLHSTTHETWQPLTGVVVKAHDSVEWSKPEMGVTVCSWAHERVFGSLFQIWVSRALSLTTSQRTHPSTDHEADPLYLSTED